MTKNLATGTQEPAFTFCTHELCFSSFKYLAILGKNFKILTMTIILTFTYCSKEIASHYGMPSSEGGQQF